MKGNFEWQTWLKKMIFSLIPLLGLIFLIETVSRWYYFEKTSAENAGIVWWYRSIRLGLMSRTADFMMRGLPKRDAIYQTLFTAEGKDMLDYFHQEYESNFARLVKEVKATNARLVVLYLPATSNKEDMAAQHSRIYFPELAKRYNVDFYDFSEIFARQEFTAMTLYPRDGHYSRYGNQVLSEALKAYLAQFVGQGDDSNINSKEGESKTTFLPVLGKLPPESQIVHQEIKDLPYLVTVNRQGFRGMSDIENPKKKTRILCLGDSYTFGSYVNDHDTYPAVLSRIWPEVEVINAGMSGYTITDEEETMRRVARKLQPDIVVLQVLDNDLTDLFYFKQNRLGRTKDYKPSAQEIEFLRKLKNK